MRIQTIIFSLVLSFFSLATMAHDHSHSHGPVSQDQAEAIALKSVSKLADKGKIDKSWKSTKASKVEKIQFNGNMEWVIIFNNKNISDPAKLKLYIFLSLGGEYLAANFTGM